MKRIWTEALQPRHAVVLLAVSFGAVLIALEADGLRREYVSGIEAASSQTENLARVLEEDTRQTLRRVELSLARAADEIRRAGDLSRTDPAALRQRLGVHLPEDGLISSFAIIGRDGAIVLSTGAEDARALPSVADRDYFVAHRDRAGLGMVIGAAVKSRVDGKWVMPVSSRLAAPGGAFQGVLLAVVEPTYFQRFYDSIDTGANGFVALFQRQGWIVARSPFNEDVLKRNWSDSPMFRVHLAVSEAKTVRQVIVADGIERIYSYRALKEYPVIVSLGLSLTDTLAPWRTRAWRDGIILAIVLSGLAGATLALTRQLRQRETAENALRASEERFRGLTELSSDYFWETDAEHRFMLRSSGGKQSHIAEIRAGAQMGKRRWELTYLSPDAAGWKAHQATLDAHLPFRNFEFSRPGDGGVERFMSISGEPIFNESGEFKGYRGVGHDITGQKQAEKKLIALAAELEEKVASRTEELAEALEAATAADRMKSDFMANVTHELRTPLNSIIGFAELLKEGVAGPLNEQQAAFAADILAAGWRQLAVVEGILKMSRLEAAGAALEREPVEIGAALEERVAARRKAAEARGLTVRLDVAPDTGRAELDPKELRQMLDLLIDNAIKFNREGGAVTVSARRAGGVLEIAVADTGIGIAREDLGKLFKPLVQLDAGFARRHGGVGLGLALARRLAELHGGTIEIESEPGKGSVFTLRLPTGEKS